MNSPERRVFDRSFALQYPETNGLIEYLENDDRIIAQNISTLEDNHEKIFRLLQSSPDLSFDSVDINDKRYYIIPLDSRGLKSYIRLSKEDNQLRLGKIFGQKLNQLYDITGGFMPAFDIINRFAVHSTQQHSQEYNQSNISGIDIKILPPFSNFEYLNEKNNIISLINEELQDNLGDQFDKINYFLDGVRSGIESI